MADSTLLTKKDWLSLGFSAVALLLSLVAAYYNFFRHVDDVQVRVADFESENKLESTQDQLITYLAFINRGNQPALVTGAEWIVAPNVDLSEGSSGGPVTSPDGDFPFVLEKGEMKLVRVTSSRESIEENSGGEIRLHYGITVASIDGQGNEHGARLFFSTLKLRQSKIWGLSYKHASADLFGDSHVAFRMTR